MKQQELGIKLYELDCPYCNYKTNNKGHTPHTKKLLQPHDERTQRKNTMKRSNCNCPHCHKKRNK